jgi:mannose-6-phosphate isomerase
MKNKIQPYAWGMRGKNAFIPRLLGLKPDNDSPYAELWMGAHPNAPSGIEIGGSAVSLDRLIDRYPFEILGQNTAERFSNKLPFLFKVLSASEALSIQAHPDKKQAQVLHHRDPEHYVDGNHKPETAIALDSFTALIGFKPINEIIKVLKRTPELYGFIGSISVETLEKTINQSEVENKKALKLLYTNFMNRALTAEQHLCETIDRLQQRLTTSVNSLSEEEQIFLDLMEKYSGPDIGLLSIFLLNIVHLKEGQAVFLDAGIPHAYLKGNIVECMANSDNVVRAGLTSKFKDIKTLLEVLKFEAKLIPVHEVDAEADEVIYPIPVTEYRISRWKFQDNQKRNALTENSPQILLVLDGTVRLDWLAESEYINREFHRGQSILIPAFLTEYDITAIEKSILFRIDVPF